MEENEKDDSREGRADRAWMDVEFRGRGELMRSCFDFSNRPVVSVYVASSLVVGPSSIVSITGYALR